MKRIRVLLHAVAFTAVLAIALAGFGPLSRAHAQSQKTSVAKPLEDYVEAELGRIDEAYTLVERFGSKVWPGWDNYLEPEVYAHFPNGIHLLVGSPDHAPEGYERVAGRNIHGKAVYVSRKDELPIQVKQPLIGGGKGGASVHIFLSQVRTPEVHTEKDGGFSESQILVYVHELFHGLQYHDKLFDKLEKANPRANETKNASGTFTVDLNYATWSSVEGRALLAAFDAKDAKTLRECLEDYLVARHEKQKGMPPDVIAAEQSRQNPEGTALFSNTKMAQLIYEAKYKGNKSHGADRYFFQFAQMDGYVRKDLIDATKYTMDETLDTLSKYYQFGALETFGLDRLARGWKKGFFQSGRTLDEVLGERLRLTAADEQRIKARLLAKYNIPELEAKHRPVIEKRDQALALIAGRKGRRYVVDFSKLPRNDVVAIETDYLKEHVRLGVHVIYPHGTKVSLAQVELVSVDTPIEKFLRTVEWIDTDSKPTEKGYELNADSKDGDVLKDVTLTTKGFTLKAPEVQLVEDKDKDEVRVLILSKVKK